MTPLFLRTLFALFVLLCVQCLAADPRDTMPDTRAATDALGRVLPMSTEVGPPKPNRTVGIFYFNWHAAFGNPQVHDIAKILAVNPAAPPWGPVQAPHYWSEPRFGYYRPDDPWVIRKHVQMLSDAGVDVLILDATNGFTYDAEREALCVVLEQMKAEGQRIPQIAMFAYAQHHAVVPHLWETFYQPGKHRDLWFQWKGKPLLLTPPDGLTEEVKTFFTIRTSWAWTRGQPWFGDGRDKWPWLDSAPQVPGWHEASNKAECVPVGVSQHATSNIGRSFHGSRQPPPAECRSGEGLYFEEQWRHALPHDPEFLFITGWNEWVAQRFLSDGTMTFLGRVLPAGETFFVDDYSPEFSRDIEPMRGGFGDNYYWQMVANIRRYKGARPLPAASPAKTIAIPGDFAQWAEVKPVYLDDLHDTTHRDHDGVPGAGRYTNQTGRNDLDSMHVTHDDTHLFFHVRTRDALTASSDPDWMVLLLDSDQNAGTGSLGYDYRLNRLRSSPGIASIERWNGNAWEHAGTARLEVGTNELHLAADRAVLDMTAEKPVRFDFKWTDNVPADAHGMDFLDQGDTAPNARFNYRYSAVSDA
ncbi:MAG: hypothetical protein JNJ70_25795 [Verrucomicrobiales bacterium]|nr:hypothetical protein [Verrucomicrobiales bacterium]